jgi:hypothetical protein
VSLGHGLDAAHLFTPALETGSAGARYHGVAEEGAPLRDIADVIGRRLNVPVAARCPRRQLIILAGSHTLWVPTLGPQACKRTNRWDGARRSLT